MIVKITGQPVWHHSAEYGGDTIYRAINGMLVPYFIIGL